MLDEDLKKLVQTYYAKLSADLKIESANRSKLENVSHSKFQSSIFIFEFNLNQNRK